MILEEQPSCNAMKLETDMQDNWWILHVDGASNSQKNGAHLIFANPDGVIAEYALRFDFSAMNNMAEYEVLIVGLRIIKELGIKKVKVFFDSQLVMS